MSADGRMLIHAFDAATYRQQLSWSVFIIKTVTYLQFFMLYGAICFPLASEGGEPR